MHSLPQPTLRAAERAADAVCTFYARGVAPRESLILTQNQHRHAADIDASLANMGKSRPVGVAPGEIISQVRFSCFCYFDLAKTN